LTAEGISYFASLIARTGSRLVALGSSVLLTMSVTVLQVRPDPDGGPEFCLRGLRA
jgi:hypothetical protein